jgi:transcriptional regulator with XRE-family HTH domain
MTEHKRWLDVERLTLALDAIRSHRGMSWRAVAREACIDPAALHRLTSGGNAVSADNLVAVMVWANISDLRLYLLPERRAELAAYRPVSGEGQQPDD